MPNNSFESDGPPYTDHAPMSSQRKLWSRHTSRKRSCVWRILIWTHTALSLYSGQRVLIWVGLVRVLNHLGHEIYLPLHSPSKFCLSKFHAKCHEHIWMVAVTSGWVYQAPTLADDRPVTIVHYIDNRPPHPLLTLPRSLSTMSTELSVSSLFLMTVCRC